MKEYLFVYGLFRDSAQKLIEDSVFCGKAYVNGELYKVNEFYPGFIKGNGKVIGDVYLIDSSIFRNLDDFEGEEYNRIKIKTSNDIECWIYEYKYDTSNFDKIIRGDWMLR